MEFNEIFKNVIELNLLELQTMDRRTANLSGIIRVIRVIDEIRFLTNPNSPITNLDKTWCPIVS